MHKIIEIEPKNDCREFMIVPFRNIIVVELSSSLCCSTEEPEHLRKWGFFLERWTKILGLKLKMGREGNWGLKVDICRIVNDGDDREGEIRNYYWVSKIEPL